MLNHLYSPQMSDLFVRLLDYNKNVFTKEDDNDKEVIHVSESAA